jgi:hypothetical protein
MTPGALARTTQPDVATLIASTNGKDNNSFIDTPDNSVKRPSGAENDKVSQ